MRIWIINQNAYAPTESAGTRHYELARRLQDKGHDVLIVATSFYHKSRRESRIYDDRFFLREEVNGVPFHWIKTPPYHDNGFRRVVNQLAFMRRVWSGLGLDGSRPDVIIGSSPPLFGALGAERLARRLKVPFVLEIRDIWPETLIGLGGMSVFHPFILLLEVIERFLYRTADHIATVLPLAGSYILSKGGRNDEVTWIPNGVSLADVPELPPMRGKDSLTLMYAGSHGLYNGLDILLKAVSRLRQRGIDGFQIQLLGDGPHKTDLIDIRDSLGLGNVEFMAPVPKSDVHRHLARADVFIMILRSADVFRWGISPNKLYDYMACARPILFAVDTPSDPVSEELLGVSCLPDSDAIEEGILKIIKLSLHERTEMGKRARNYVCEQHDFDTLADRMEAMLNRIVV